MASRVRTPCTPSALAPRLGLASPGHGRQSPSTKVQAWRKQRLRPGRLVCKAKASAWRDNSHSVTLLGERMGLTTPPSSDSVARSCSLGPPGLWQRCRGGEEVFLPLGSVGLWGGPKGSGEAVSSPPGQAPSGASGPLRPSHVRPPPSLGSMAPRSSRGLEAREFGSRAGPGSRTRGAGWGGEC